MHTVVLYSEIKVAGTSYPIAVQRLKSINGFQMRSVTLHTQRKTYEAVCVKVADGVLALVQTAIEEGNCAV